mgnify:FL=1
MSSRRCPTFGRCVGLLSALTVGYVLGFWQGGTFSNKIGAERSAFGVEEEIANRSAIYSDSASQVGGEEEMDIGNASEEPEAAIVEVANATKGCSKFSNVDFPLEGWPSSVRAEGGESLYGTGWAQKFLRDHQFPHKCAGKSFVEHGMSLSGIGSNMHIGAAVLAFALNKGRIYLWPEDDKANPWTEGKKSIVNCPGQQSRNYECYLKPVSSCKPNGEGPRFTGVKRDRGRDIIKSTELIPKVFKELLKCSGYPSNYWVKWWRAQAAAFLLRPKQETLVELQTLREEHLVGRMQAGVLGCYVRHGDKYYEASEYPLKDYQRIFSWILDDNKEVLQKCPGAEEFLKPFKAQLPKLQSSRRLYLGSDDPDVIEEAKSFGEMIYMNVSRLSKRTALMKLTKKLGAKQVVMESLLNMQLLMESDAFIGTWTSNWCRLVDEMRMTVAMKASHLSLEVNKHCPRFNWVHGHGRETPDYR